MKKAVLGLAFVVICIALRSSAWEKDLHYGLTKWLAFKAGFSLDNAEIIALGTEAPDEGKLYPAVGAVIHAACTGRDNDLSKLVQQFHFPGYGPVPGPPDKRRVDPGIHDNASTDMVQKEVQANLPNQPPDTTLTNLGVALHPLEDSWSHQGQPDSSIFCSKELFWGHPADRDGWRSHDADLTYLHEQDTLQTAERTYDLLIAFLKNHPRFKRDPKLVPPPFNTLKPELLKFVHAASKADKLAWFQAQTDVPFARFSDQHFLDHIDLDDTSNKKLTVSRPGIPFPQAPRVIAAQQYLPPRDLEAFVENFLTIWIIKHGVEDLPRFTDLRQFSESVQAEGGPSAGLLKTADPAAVTQLFFFMWLVRDHGYVNHLGHGSGWIAATERRLTVPDQLRLLRDQPLIQVNSLRGPQSNFQLYRYPDSDDYAVTVEFAHAPRDVVVLTVGRGSAGSNQQWLVKRMDWSTL